MMQCELCGREVNLEQEIIVTSEDGNGIEVSTRMPESKARALLAELGLPPPPVICDQHSVDEVGEVTTTRD